MTATATPVVISWEAIVHVIVGQVEHASGTLMDHDSFVGHARVRAIFTHQRSPVGLVLAYTDGNADVLAVACHIAHGRCGKFLGASEMFSVRRLTSEDVPIRLDEIANIAQFWQRAREEHGPLVEVPDDAPAGLHRETFTTCVGPHDVVVTLTGPEESVYVMRAMIQHVAEFGDKCALAQTETSE